MSFSWTPPTGLNDTSAFPAKDTGFRARMQALLQQLATYVDTNKADKTQEAWITPALLNGWVNYGSVYAPLRYYKDSIGEVHIQGWVKSGAADSVIFVLPVGYRPAKLIQNLTSNSGAFGQYSIGTDGSVSIIGGSASVYLSLNNITFRAEQ